MSFFKVLNQPEATTFISLHIDYDRCFDLVKHASLPVCCEILTVLAYTNLDFKSDFVTMLEACVANDTIIPVSCFIGNLLFMNSDRVLLAKQVAKSSVIMSFIQKHLTELRVCECLSNIILSLGIPEIRILAENSILFLELAKLMTEFVSADVQAKTLEIICHMVYN